MTPITDLRDAIAAIRGNSTICAVRLESGRWCPRLAVGGVVVRAHADPRCPSHLPDGAAKVCRSCRRLNESSDPWRCEGCRDDT